MRPILLKGHERSITALKYNREGDLMFTTSKAPVFAVWYTDNGERLGTYSGHTGAVWGVDIDRNSTHCFTASADASSKMWDVEVGKEIDTWGHKAPVRAVSVAYGDKQFLTVTDQVLNQQPLISVWDPTVDSRRKANLEIQLTKNEARVIQAVWGPLNRTIVTAHEDGVIRIFDANKGELIKVLHEHNKAVMDLSFNADKTLLVSASKDGTAKLFDTKTWETLKTYSTGRPINSASISPLRPEVIVGGGQSAESVTTTRVDNSQFRVRFFHMIFEEELGSVPGHFGPVNVVSYSPDGRGFASGGEDGYVRLHHFDKEYFMVEEAKDAKETAKSGTA